MTPKEKKAFVARMKKGRAAAKKNKKKGNSWASKIKKETDQRRSDREYGIIYPPNFKSIGKRDNFAWVEKSGKKYQVITFRKHSTPQYFLHKNMSKKEAINYAQSFNFLNKS